MNKNNKKKQQLAQDTIVQLINFHQNPNNKHFAYIGIDDNDESSPWNSLVLAGDTGLLAHALFEERTLLPYDLRLHMMIHILTEDTDLVIEAQKLIKQSGFKSN